MTLSNDPEKRARQLENLSKGGQVAAQRHSLPAFPAGHGAQGDPATTGSSDLGHETAGGEDRRRGDLPVVGYGPVSSGPAFAAPANEPKEETSTQPAAEPRAAAGDVDEHELEHDVDQEHELEEHETHERGGLGGLLDGFVGR